MTASSKSITRLELYWRIWQTPPEALARELGVGPHVLRENCNTHQVPWPPVDYWARKAGGLVVSQPRLCRINGRLSYALPNFQSPAVQPCEQINHPDDARPTHSKNHIATSQLGAKRRQDMMKRLFSQAETLGIIPAVGKLNIVTFSKCTTTIRGRLREKLEKCNPPLAEKAKLQLPQHLRRSSLTPTGCLYFEIDPNCIALGKKRRWTESPSRPFDQMICEIVGAVHHALLERMENDRRADDRRELERSARRALWRAQEETQLEESRWAVLVASAQQALELKHVEQLLATFEQDEIENSNIHGDRTTAEWLAWIRAQIIERYKRIANIEETIRRIASLR